MYDIRLAFRQLRKSPAFTAVVLITLSLSIGAATLIYSAIDGVLLRPLEGRDTNKLVTIRTTRGMESDDDRISGPNFYDWQRLSTSFSGMSASNFTTLNLTGEGEALKAAGMRITWNFYDVLGLPLTLGRAFLPEEETVGNNRVVILSYPLWKNTFGSDTSVIGRSIMLNELPHVVVGVGPREMDQVGDRSWRPDLAVPMVYEGASTFERRDRNILNVQARLKPGVSMEQAQSEMDSICANLAQQYPDSNLGTGAILMRTHHYLTRSIRPVLWSLLGAVACLLLIACANVANLLLARATVRQREMSVRSALGAGTRHLMRQMLTESILLSLIGGTLGVMLAAWGLEALKSYPASGELVRLAKVELHTGILGVSLLISVATGLIFGIAPAWLASRVNINDTLKQGTRGSTESGGLGRLRNILVVFEVACALVLLSCSGLLLHSFMKLSQFDPGFEPEKVAFIQVILRGERYADGLLGKPEPINRFTEDVLVKLRALPGVEIADAGYLPMMSVIQLRPFRREDQTITSLNEMPTYQYVRAGESLFSVLGVPLIQGRLYTESDRTGPTLIVINETLARLHFAGENPIGKRLDFNPNPEEDFLCEIVGVVSDLAPRQGEPATAQVFFANDGYQSILDFVVRTKGDPQTLLNSMRKVIHQVDPNIAIAHARTLSDVMGDSIARQRFAFHLLGLFAIIALIVASFGIYGVMAYTISQRTTEFGIRMALGAKANDVLRLVFVNGSRLVGIGLLLGLIGTFMAGRIIQSQLYETESSEPLVVIGITLLFAAIATLACWIPARRATQVDPMIALRGD